MPGNVDNIYSHVRNFTGKRSEDLTIDATLDPNIPIFVACSAITSVENSRVRLVQRRLSTQMNSLVRQRAHLHVSLKVSIVVTPDCTSNGRPGALQNKNAFNVVSYQFLVVGK